MPNTASPKYAPLACPRIARRLAYCSTPPTMRPAPVSPPPGSRVGYFGFGVALKAPSPRQRSPFSATARGAQQGQQALSLTRMPLPWWWTRTARPMSLRSLNFYCVISYAYLALSCNPSQLCTRPRSPDCGSIASPLGPAKSQGAQGPPIRPHATCGTGSQQLLSLWIKQGKLNRKASALNLLQLQILRTRFLGGNWLVFGKQIGSA